MFTLRSHRQRRGPYALAPGEEQPGRWFRVIAVLVALALVLYAARGFWRWIGSGNVVQRAAATMTVEQGGPVSFAIEGGTLRRAEDSLKLAEGDRIETGAGGRARLALFDESTAMIDESSTLVLEESAKGSEASTIRLDLTMGGLWMSTSDASTLSGTILRSVTTPAFEATVPNNAEVIIRSRSVDVFAADGLGVEILADGASDPIFIGEGQHWELPADTDVSGDLYALRKPLAADAATQTLVVRARNAVAVTEPGDGPASPTTSEALTITAPRDKATIAGATVRVEGRVGPAVTRVRVNGYQAALDTEARTFTQDLAFDDETPFILHTEAIDADNVVIAEDQRSVTRDATAAAAAAAPTITEPAAGGSTYRTQASELIIKGTAPKETEGIIVNDYRLQLYEPGSGTWSYLANTELGNLKSGTNTYDVVAIDALGGRSAPVRITILVEEGASGVVGSAGSAASVGTTASTSSAPAVIEDETTLPNNAPLTPGIIAVTAPSPESPATTGSGETLIEGTTSAQTDSMWVNGYRLRLYLPGKTTWNYIASTQYSTLKRGNNTYRIVARNAAGEILDTKEYVMVYEP